MAPGWNGLDVKDPPADAPPRRVPQALRAAIAWILFAVNVLAVTSYFGFVVVPWLLYYSGRDVATCYGDTGCPGPAFPSLSPALTYLLLPAIVILYLVVSGGPVVALLLGGLTAAVAALRLRYGRTGRRTAMLVAGTLMLALGIFQMSPLGMTFDARASD